MYVTTGVYPLDVPNSPAVPEVRRKASELGADIPVKTKDGTAKETVPLSGNH